MIVWCNRPVNGGQTADSLDFCVGLGSVNGGQTADSLDFCVGLGLWCSMPHSTIFQLLYRGGHSDLLVEETGVSGENHWPVASHW